MPLCHFAEVEEYRWGNKHRFEMGIKELMGINKKYLIWELGFALDNEESS